MSSCHLITTIWRMRLVHAAFFDLTDEVNFKTVLIIGEPGTEMARVAWALKLSQPQYLAIEATRTLNIFHKEGYVIEFVNVHKCFLQVLSARPGFRFDPAA